MITQEELEALSHKVAELYGVDARVYVCQISEPPPRSKRTGYVIKPVKIWLHDDWATLMPLAVANGLSIEQVKFGLSHKVVVKEPVTILQLNRLEFTEGYARHASPDQATRVAIMKALIAVKG